MSYGLRILLLCAVCVVNNDCICCILCHLHILCVVYSVLCCGVCLLYVMCVVGVYVVC